MSRNEFRHRVVVHPAEPEREVRFDAVEEGQGIGREELQVDAEIVHQLETPVHVHEHGAAVDDRHAELADTERRGTAAVHDEFRPMPARRAESCLEDGVGVDVDDPVWRVHRR